VGVRRDGLEKKGEVGYVGKHADEAIVVTPDNKVGSHNGALDYDSSNKLPEERTERGGLRT